MLGFFIYQKYIIFKKEQQAFDAHICQGLYSKQGGRNENQGGNSAAAVHHQRSTHHGHHHPMGCPGPALALAAVRELKPGGGLGNLLRLHQHRHYHQWHPHRPLRTPSDRVYAFAPWLSIILKELGL